MKKGISWHTLPTRFSIEEKLQLAMDAGFNGVEVAGENSDKEIYEFIDTLINERTNFIKEKGLSAVGPLMGPVMSKFRGKMDGEKINKILIQKIKETL